MSRESNNNLRPEPSALGRKKIRQGYLLVWIGGLSLVLITVAVVANFNIGKMDFQLEEREHAPAQPLQPTQANGSMSAQLSARRLEQVYNQVADMMDQSTIGIVVTRAGGGDPAIGSGFIVAGTYVLTNLHVLENAQSINITLGTPVKATFPAMVAALDQGNDLALLEVATPYPLASAIIGDSEAVDIGDIVFAEGSPRGLGNTITTGIVSDRRKTITVNGREYRDLLQTSTPTYLGSSGGPLVNLSGQVIGVNTVIYSPRGNFTGISFAVPINRAAAILSKVDPSVANTGNQNFGLTANPCTTNQNCFVPAADPGNQGQLLQDNYPQVAASEIGTAEGTTLQCPRDKVCRVPTCTFCGNPMTLDASGTQLVCPNGHSVGIDAFRCPVCGTRMVSHQYPTTAGQSEQPFSLAV